MSLTPTRRTGTRSRVLALTAALALALGGAACGSDSLDGESSGSGNGSESAAPTALPEVQANPELAAKVPEALRSAGVVKVGSNGTYAPVDILDPDGKTMSGIDVDIFDAVAAKLDLKTEWQNAAFDTILMGVTSGKWDVGASAFTINDERKQAVNMVQYFNAGTSWAVAAGNPQNVNPDEACGLKVAVQSGTVQVDDIEARSKECVDAGKPAIVSVVEAENTKGAADVISGKADALVSDSPITSYAVDKSDGQLEQVGDIYDSAPYGFIVPKDQTEFADVISDALEELDEDGTYKAILAKWGNEDGAVDEFPVNP